MSFTKITSADLADKGVVGLADTPNLSVTALQKKFDEIATDVVVPKFNNLCDELDTFETTVDINERVKSDEITNIRTNDDDKIEISKDGGTTWEMPSSSGHIVMDGTGRQYSQRSRLQFSANTVITDDSTDDATFIQIPSGTKGDKGDSATIQVGTVETATEAYVTNVGSDQDAIFNFGIPKGTDGSAATIQVGTVTQGTNASVSNRGTSSAAIFDFVLPKGDKGDTGTSFQVLGSYATYEELIAAHPTGTRGAAYAVGTSESNVVYNWNTDTRTWDNLGPLKGAKGDDGSAATVTAGTVTTLDPGTDAYVTNDGSTSAAIFSFGIPKGSKGDTGNAATISVGTVSGGETASVVNSGTTSNAVFDFVIPKGDKGDSGDPAIVNGKSGESIVLYGMDIYNRTYAKKDYAAITTDDSLTDCIEKLEGGVSKVDDLEEDVTELKSDLSNFESTTNTKITNVFGTSDAYSASTTYAVGDVCVYDNKLWKCLVACSAQTPSEGTYWTQISLKSLIDSGSVIKKESVTGTTGANSAFNCGITKPILSAHCTSNTSYGCILEGGGMIGMTLYKAIGSGYGYGAVTNTSVTVDVYYLDI